jgi:glutathione S-transferase
VKLYYSPGSCALVVHVLLRELGVAFELERVDTGKGEHRAEAYLKLNPKGKVPLLVTSHGPLTECVAMIEYLCDHHGGEHLLGKPGSWERAKVMERVATLATEIHPLFNRFFHEDDFAADAAARAAVKARGTEKLLAYFREQDAVLTGEHWSGPRLTAADFYFMVIARWGRWLDPSAIRMENIEPWYRRMVERPAVAKSLEAEGIKAFG